MSNDGSFGVRGEHAIGDVAASKDRSHEPPSSTSRSVKFREECYGSNLAIEVTAGTVDFRRPPYGPYEYFERTPKHILLTEAGQLDVDVFGSVDASQVIVDPEDQPSPDPDFGPGSFHRGGQAIIEFTNASGKVSRVGILTMSMELDLVVGDNEETIALEGKRLELDGAICTYIVGPHGEVVRGREGFSLPPPVTIGQKYSQVETIAAKASRPDVKDPAKFAAFANLGNVTRVIIDAKRPDYTTTFPEVGENPFLKPLEAVRQYIRKRASENPTPSGY